MPPRLKAPRKSRYHYYYYYYYYCYNTSTIISIPDRAAEDEDAVAGGVDGVGPAEITSQLVSNAF
jgi:hypothetical protein